MATRATRLKADPAGDSPWKPSAERARQREIKREAVILAAARAFRQRGYHNTSVDDLAALLNVTKPTIYHYLDNKEEILFECFRTGLDQIMSAFDEIRGSDRPALERLSAVVRRYAQAITSEFGWCMVRAEDQDLSPVMSRRINALKSQIDQGIRALIKDGIADGSISRCDPKITAFALAGAMNWIAHWHRADAELTPDQIADRFLATFVNGLKPR
ncbi:MAG: TetR/AcrR family transcriptional regulator [Steroidobacteraceae bacterium]